jgi:hypothetical protein
VRILRSGLALLLLLAACSSTTTSTPSPTTPGTEQGAQTPGDPGAGGVPGEDPNAPPWEKIRDEDGIVVFRREIEGSPVVAFRGEGIVNAPIARVALVQMNLERGNEWIDRLKEARVIEARSDSEFLTYSHVGAPPLVSDRDFVNQVKVDFDPPNRIKYNLHSVEDPKGPPTAGVRGKLLHSSFELTVVGPEQTRVVCEIHADPKGSLPKWVVNQFQKGWAFKTISGLRKQAQKTDLTERAPQIRDLLARNGFPQ